MTSTNRPDRQSHGLLPARAFATGTVRLHVDLLRVSSALCP